VGSSRPGGFEGTSGITSKTIKELVGVQGKGAGVLNVSADALRASFGAGTPSRAARISAKIDTLLARVDWLQNAVERARRFSGDSGGGYRGGPCREG